MFDQTERKSIWKEFATKKNLTIISKEELFLSKEKILNPLILPFPFDDEKFFEIIKNKFKGDIYTEVLNLFFFIKTKIEYLYSVVYIYEMDIKKDIVSIETFNLETNEKKSFQLKAFTPKGIEEYLDFKGFKLKEIWGDIPSGKIKEKARFLLLRIDKK